MAMMLQDPQQDQDILALTMLCLLILQTRHHLLLTLMHSFKVPSNGTEDDSLTGIITLPCWLTHRSVLLHYNHFSRILFAGIILIRWRKGPCRVDMSGHACDENMSRLICSIACFSAFMSNICLKIYHSFLLCIVDCSCILNTNTDWRNMQNVAYFLYTFFPMDIEIHVAQWRFWDDIHTYTLTLTLYKIYECNLFN